MSPLPVAKTPPVGLGATEMTVCDQLEALQADMSWPTGIFMSLQHELCNTGMGIPELDTTVLGSTQNPVAVWSKRNAEYKVLK